MSFVCQYHRFIGVSIQDNAGSSLDGFSFKLSSKSKKLLLDHQLVYKARENGFELYYQTNPLAEDPILSAITSPVSFSFALFQTRPDFFKRYQPNLSKDTGPQLYLDNLTSTGDIQLSGESSLSVGNEVKNLDAVKIYPSVFFVAADTSGPGAASEFIISKKYDSTSSPIKVPITPETGQGKYGTKIDLSKQAAGPYTLKTDAADSALRNIYKDDELAGMGPLGVVDIHWKTKQSDVGAGGKSYVIRFKRR